MVVSRLQVGCIRVTHPCATLKIVLLQLIPYNLHVLSLPLAFILSQDQTLHCKYDLICLKIYSSRPSLNRDIRCCLFLASVFSKNLSYSLSPRPLFPSLKRGCKSTIFFIPCKHQSKKYSFTISILYPFCRIGECKGNTSFKTGKRITIIYS
jgi:hypothetical protein